MSTALDILAIIEALVKENVEPDMALEDAMLLLEDQSTEVNMVMKILRTNSQSIRVAEAVARHPSLGRDWLLKMNAWLPESAQKNPQWDAFLKEDKFIKQLEFYQKKGGPLRGYAGSSYSGSGVNRERPELYRVPFFLEKGSAQDFRYLADIKAIPNEIFRAYLKNRNSHLRKALAARQYFDPADYKTISQDKLAAVRQVLAENPAIPAELIEQLTQDKQAKVREAALSNPNCPEGIVHAAQMEKAAAPTANDKPLTSLKPEEIAGLLLDPSTSSEKVDQIASQAEPHIRYACGLHPNASENLLKALSTDTCEWLAEAVGFNPASPSKLLQTLGKKSSSGLRRALASNASTPEAVQLKIAETASRDIRYLLANSTNDAAVWKKMAEVNAAKAPEPKTGKSAKKVAAWEDHLATVLDPNTPAKTLRGLQRSNKSRHTFVARLTARHPNCPESHFPQYGYYCYGDLANNPKFAMLLLESPDAAPSAPVKDWLLNEWARYDTTPGHIVNFQLTADDQKHKRRAARNNRASINLLQPLVFDPDVLMRKSLAERPDLTRFMFEVLARDEKPKVRELIAKNKNCPAELLTLLGEDKTASVRAAAAQHPRFSKKKTAKKAGKASAPKLDVMRDKGPKRERIKIAKEAISGPLLEDLAQDKVPDVRAEVAGNQKIPLKTLLMLLTDEVLSVRLAATKNDKVTIKILEPLFSDPDETIRLSAFQHARWSARKKADLKPVSALMVADESAKIRATVARSTEDPAHQRTLCDDADSSVLVALSKNRQLDATLGTRLFEGDDDKIRCNVIKNTQDIDLLERGAVSESERIQAAAGHNSLIAQHAERLVPLHNAKINHVLAYEAKIANALFDEFVKGGNPSVINALASSARINRTRIGELLALQMPNVVQSLIEYEKLNKKDIDSLVRHENIELRKIVASHAKLDKEQFELLLNERSIEICNALAWGELTSVQEKQLRKMRQDLHL